MELRSEVQITAEPEALKLFKSAVSKYNWNFHVNETDEHGVIRFVDIEWNTRLEGVEDVEEIEELLRTDDYNNAAGYGFKTIILKEDNTEEEYANARGCNIFSDACVHCYINNPYDC